MSRQRSASGFLVLLISLLCLAGAFVLWALIEVPQRVELVFGKPSPNLALSQRLSLTMQLFLAQEQLIHPHDPQGNQQTFEVALGESVGSVADRLEAGSIITDGEVFRVYMVYRGLDVSMQAGLYELSAAAAAISIAQQIQDASPGEVSLTIFPGWRIEEVAEAVRVSGVEINPDEFTDEAYHAPYGIPIGQPDPEIISMEGFLFPGTYQLPRVASMDDVFRLVLLAFDQQVSPQLQQAITNQGLSFYEGIILASIVQREAMIIDEQPLIASVFLNRLRFGMGLYSDPTVQYALGYDSQDHTWWKSPLTTDDLGIDSPYNTYLQMGLPPAPICSPGLPAIKAVANPKASDFLYFRASCDGSGRHFFSVTYEEHLQNACP